MRIEETRVWVWCGYLPWAASSAAVHTSSIPISSTVRHAKYDCQAPEGPLLPTFSSSICTKASQCSTAATQVNSSGWGGRQTSSNDIDANHTSNCATQGFRRQPLSVTQYRTEKSCRRCGEEQCVLIARYEPREQICTHQRQFVLRASNECNLNLRQVSSISIHC